MSEPISRRTFLKASGLAVLSAAAASALAGCGGGNWTPETPLPTLDNTTKKTFNVGTATVTFNLGSFVKAASREGKYYIYTYLQIDNTMNQDAFPVSISDFTCTVGDAPAKVYSLGSFSAGTTPTKAVQVGSITPEKFPFYLEVSEEQYQSIDSTSISVTFQKDSDSVTFTYNTGISPYPQGTDSQLT